VADRNQSAARRPSRVRDGWHLHESGGVVPVEFSRYASPEAVPACQHIFTGILGGDCVGQIANVIAGEVICQRIKLSRFQAVPQASPAVLGALRAREPAELAVRVEVHQPAGVAVAQPDRRNPRDDVVVVDPTVVFRESAVIDVAPGADARAAEGEQPGRVRFDFRQHAAACANRRHRGAKRMAGEPRSLVVFGQRGLHQWPEGIHFLLEAAMDTADGLGQDSPSIDVGLDIVPFVRLGATADDDRIVLVGDEVGLSAFTLEIRRRVQPNLFKERTGCFLGVVGNIGKLREQERLSQYTQAW
jgi:hypothetical protein